MEDVFIQPLMLQRETLNPFQLSLLMTLQEIKNENHILLSLDRNHATHSDLYPAVEIQKAHGTTAFSALFYGILLFMLGEVLLVVAAIQFGKEESRRLQWNKQWNVLIVPMKARKPHEQLSGTKMR